LGGIFTGNFRGGTFSKGHFDGQFFGGIYVLSKDTKWGLNAGIPGGPGKRYIKVNNKVYPWTFTDSPEKEWQYIQTEQASKASGIPGGITDLSEYITVKLGYKCDLKIDDDWEQGVSNEQKYVKFKQSFAWLFLVRKWNSAPAIHVTKRQIDLTEGELVVGAVMFDYYGEDVVIKGGQITGRNTFKGKFYGGIYREGQFEGTFLGGTFNLDKAVWTKSARGAPPKNLADEFVYAVVFKNKLYKIPRELLVYEEGGKKIYQDIGEIQKVLSAGKWGEVVASAKKVYQKGSVKGKRFRGDDDAIDLDPSESDVPDWASDDSGGNAIKFHAPESYRPASGSMLSLMYEHYLNKGNHPVAEHTTMFGESFGYYLNSRPGGLQDSFACDFSEMRWVSGLREKEFRYDDLSGTEQDALYEVFKQSYIKATGAAFDRDGFDWRAAGWQFFGNPPDDRNPNAPVGGIAVRRQQANVMFKLVASFGDFRSVLRGFDEFKSRHGNDPVWGFTDDTIRKLILKHDHDFISVPGLVVKAMEGMIKKMSGGEVKSVGLDGSLTVDTPAGIMKKYMIGNKSYARFLVDSIEDPKNAGRIPVPQVVLQPLLGTVKALL
jgi:hypothetical protein